MSPKDWRDRIRNILDAIDEIQKFTRGADTIRVHDVKEMVLVAKMTDAIVRNDIVAGAG